MKNLAPGHGSLVIEMLNDKLQSRMKLEFHFVAYFGGWTQWMGADFRVATDAEYIKFIRQYPLFEDEADEHLLATGSLATAKLFVCDSVNMGSIHVLATGGSLLDRDGKEIIQGVKLQNRRVSSTASYTQARR